MHLARHQVKLVEAQPEIVEDAAHGEEAAAMMEVGRLAIHMMIVVQFSWSWVI